MNSAPVPAAVRQQRLKVRRCGITVARVAVQRLHRHLRKPPPSGLVAFEVLDEHRWPRGWAMVGRPSSRHLQAAGWVEVTRVATEGTPNACSALYGAAARWALEQGRPVLTYTREDEPGASLRGAGWVELGLTRAEEWERHRRRRAPAKGGPVRKRRWIPGQLWRALMQAIASICVVRP